MKDLKLLIPLLLITLLACNKNQRNNQNVINQKDTLANVPIQKKEKLNPDTHAIRGQATRILKPSAFPGATFFLLGDSITGIETAKLQNGDKLIVTNAGSEYYTLSFRIETSRFQGDTTDIPFWFKKAIILMKELEKGFDSPLDITKGTNTMLKFIDDDSKNQFANVKLCEQFDYGGDDIRTFVWLNRIEKINDKKYAIEINYSMGPL
ncbi:MAG: hypothetical protein PHT07_22960 [Paludibacter sp.]|nr:hypothetical protein [Paludibacter sp.]